MGLDRGAIGRRGRTTSLTWTARDSAIYALGIGAGGDPQDMIELPYATERAAYPMMAMAIGVDGADRPRFGDIDRSKFVHSAQELVLHGPLPLAATTQLECQITGIHDVGSGALVTWDTTGTLADEPLFTMRSTGFLIGGGRFGGDPPPPDAWVAPTTPPDQELPLPTSPSQALLYRLSGDRNPLHADPRTAEHGGFSRPILHGLAALAATARVILRGNVDGLRKLSARFTAPVYPGDSLIVRVWRTDEPDAFAFQVAGPDGRLVLDRGIIAAAASIS